MKLKNIVKDLDLDGVWYARADLGEIYLINYLLSSVVFKIIIKLLIKIGGCKRCTH